MRVRLLYEDRDLEIDGLAEPDPDLVADLELERLFAAMAGGDRHVLDVVRKLVPAGAVPGLARPDAGAVRRRQAVVADALASPATTRALYRLAGDAVEAERRVWGGALRSAELVLRRSVEVLDGLLDTVRDIRDVLDRERASLRSTGMLALADRLGEDIDDAFLAAAREGLRRLDDRTLVVTAGLGPGNRAAGFVLRRAPDARARLRERVGLERPLGFAVDLALHDQNAMNALAELRAQAVAPAAAAVAESAAHLLAFCRHLRDETAFLVGCLNLDAALGTLGVPRCRPDIQTGGAGLLADDLCDPCLALAMGGPVTGNRVDTVGRPLTVVTGANGGGKSTLLRAVGVAHLMAAAGMPVAARSFETGSPNGVLVHFPRGEAAADGDGRLDAELRRLGDLVARAQPGSLVLLNEPLSSVNERDGSAIAGELVRGLVAGGAEVWVVTHHHELASGLHNSPPAPARFLRAARGDGGERPFIVTAAPPLDTAFGSDLWSTEVGELGTRSTQTGPG